MFWIPLAMAAGGAILGKQKADRQRQIEDETRKMRAAEQQYSWASGRAPSTQIQHAGSTFGEIAGGALGGLGTGLSMQGAFKGMSDSTELTPTSDNKYANVLGGTDMANELGQRFGQSQWDQMYKADQLRAPSLYAQQPQQFGLGGNYRF